MLPGSRLAAEANERKRGRSLAAPVHPAGQITTAPTQGFVPGPGPVFFSPHPVGRRRGRGGENSLRRAEAAARDREILNRRADHLNAEVMDALNCQVAP